MKHEFQTHETPVSIKQNKAEPNFKDSFYEVSRQNKFSKKEGNFTWSSPATVHQNSKILKINQDDERVSAATDAEQRLFRYYGIDPEIHLIELQKYGIRIRVLESGSGPPVLLVPGGNGIAAELVPLIAHLKDYRVLAVNLPGGGLSDAIDFRKIDYRQHAIDTLNTILDKFQLGQIPIIANSIGGLWTLWLALSEPERISRMVLVGCPAFLFGTDAPFPMRLLSVPFVNRILFPLSQPGNPEKMRKIFCRLLHSPREMTERLPDVFPETLYRMFHLPTYRLASLSLLETVLSMRGSKKCYQLGFEQLSRIRQEVLFIWGAHDPFGSVKVGQNAGRAVPNARLEIITAGHVPYIDRPEECAKLIQGFQLHKLAT